MINHDEEQERINLIHQMRKISVSDFYLKTKDQNFTIDADFNSLLSMADKLNGNSRNLRYLAITLENLLKYPTAFFYIEAVYHHSKDQSVNRGLIYPRFNRESGLFQKKVPYLGLSTKGHLKMFRPKFQLHRINIEKLQIITEATHNGHTLINEDVDLYEGYQDIIFAFQEEAPSTRK